MVSIVAKNNKIETYSGSVHLLYRRMYGDVENCDISVFWNRSIRSKERFFVDSVRFETCLHLVCENLTVFLGFCSWYPSRTGAIKVAMGRRKIGNGKQLLSLLTDCCDVSAFML